jgi:4-hydroxy-tetrahydrodipicolinate synthase
MLFNSNVFTVIPTLFKDDNEVDYESIMTHIQNQKTDGIETIVLLGTTSETPTLSFEEQLEISQTVWDRFHTELNIVVGVGGFNTVIVKEKLESFKDICHGFMISTPYYNKPTQEGLYRHFASLVITVPEHPIILYNVPSRTGVNMLPSTTVRLYNEFENVKAIKEASGSLDQVSEIVSTSDMIVLSGDDSLTLPMLSVGAHGCVSVASNVYPKKLISMVKLFKSGNVKEAILIFKQLYNVFKLLFIETNPSPLKYFMYKYGLHTNYDVRLPLMKLSEVGMMKINYYISSDSSESYTLEV